MRPGQNKRMRGRNNNNSNNNRKGPNPLTRSYESNGPDVKIRGTAHHIGEKYLQLARDAQSSGDPVMAESYLQHAEHYFRLIASAQQAQQQAAYGYQRPPGEPQEQEEDNDDDFESLPDRFASPSERAAQNQPAPPPPPPYAERQPYNNGQPYEARQNYQNQPQPQPHYERPQNQDRGQQPERQQQNFDRNQERGNQDRSYDNRNGRGDRGGYQDRGNGQGNQGNQGGNGQQNAGDRQSDRPPRDYDNRNYRNNRGPRDYRGEAPQPREQRQPPVEEPVGGGLPAFITGPTRTVPEAPSEQAAPETTAPTTQVAGDPGEDTNLHMRPRRRRRPKGEFVAGGDEGETRQEANEPASD